MKATENYSSGASLRIASGLPAIRPEPPYPLERAAAGL